MTMLGVKLCVYPAQPCCITKILAEVSSLHYTDLSLSPRLPPPTKIRLSNGSLPTQSSPHTRNSRLFSGKGKRGGKRELSSFLFVELSCCTTAVLAPHPADVTWQSVRFIPRKRGLSSLPLTSSSNVVHSRAGSILTSCWQTLLLHSLQIQREEEWTFSVMMPLH